VVDSGRGNLEIVGQGRGRSGAGGENHLSADVGGASRPGAADTRGLGDGGRRRRRCHVGRFRRRLRHGGDEQAGGGSAGR